MKIVQSKWLTALLVFLVGWLGVAVWNIHLERARSQEDVAHAQAKIERLMRENNALEKVITYLKNPEYLARQARLKLNFKSPDEEVAYVYPKESRTPEASTASESFDGKGVLEKMKGWWYNFFRKE